MHQIGANKNISALQSSPHFGEGRARGHKASSDETIDDIGPFKIIQKKKGCRWTEDSIHLAEFALPISKNDTVLDIGAGSGIIPLILAYKSPVENIIGVEIQDDLAELAMRNVKINNLSKRIKILKNDYRTLKDVFKRKRFSVILSNPPYIPIKSGRVSPDTERAIARQEILGTLKELVHISKYLLKSNGRILYIYPITRLKEVVSALNNEGLKVVRIKFAGSGKRVKLFLIEARKSK